MLETWPVPGDPANATMPPVRRTDPADADIDAYLPGLPMRIGDVVDRRRGKQREYVAL